MKKFVVILLSILFSYSIRAFNAKEDSLHKAIIDWSDCSTLEHLGFISSLLDKGTNPSKGTNYFFGCLIDFSNFAQNKKAVIKKLIEKGASVENAIDLIFNVVNIGDYTFFKYLVDHNARINIFKDFPEVMNKPLIIYAIESGNKFPHGNRDIIEFMLEKDLSVVLHNTRTTVCRSSSAGFDEQCFVVDINTPLIAAVRMFGRTDDSAKKLIRREIVKKILNKIPANALKKNLDVRDRDLEGNYYYNPMEWAIKAQDPLLMNLIIQAQARAKDSLKSK